jgi:SAM-dependent methyltransferase
MNIYHRYVLPRLIDLVMRNEADAAERAKLVPQAAGVVVEIGIGSALNVPYYGSGVTKLYGVDPSLELWRIGQPRIKAASFPVELLAGSAEHIPLEPSTADTAVSTWTLCSIPDPTRALAEIRRILKPDGRLFFIEHGLAPDSGVGAWQGRLTPFWKRISGGCHMDRKIDSLISGAGFRFDALERAYGTGPRILAYLYRGIARIPPST